MKLKRFQEATQFAESVRDKVTSLVFGQPLFSKSVRSQMNYFRVARQASTMTTPRSSMAVAEQRHWTEAVGGPGLVC